MLHIHRAERADALADALAGILVEPLDDAFEPEMVAVPTRGMERWLTQRLSHRLGARASAADGVCANIEFPFPGTLFGEALAASTGFDPDDDPWETDRSVWPLVRVVETCAEEPWMGPLGGYLGLPGPSEAGRDHDRTVAAVRQIADLFDRYAIHRPRMVQAWAREEDVDDAGEPLNDEDVWQPRLWRRLRSEISKASPAERLDDACARLRESGEMLGWPQRVAVFPLTRLPGSYLEILSAVATWRDVHLFVLHPSPALWEAVASKMAGEPPVSRRDADPTPRLARNWILASWGRDARELQLVLARSGDSEVHHHAVLPAADTLLGRLQENIRDNEELSGTPVPGSEDRRSLLDEADRSVQVHSCHGRARQVEVVRDAILHLLAEDETIEPRDVIVMCPDIETFAPLIQATFGAGEAAVEDEGGELPPDPRPTDLRVRLADRSLRQTNPVLGVVAQLLELADSRVTASQLLSLADREPIRRRFRFDDDELGRIQEWVVTSGIHWGLDEQSRARFKLQSVPAGTWRAGLDRILLGVTMTEHPLRLFGSALPLDDVESGVIDLAGRFAEYVDRVHTAVDRLNAPKPLAEWCDAIWSAAEALALTSPWETWQSRELERLLADVQATATGRGRTFDSPVALPDVRALLADRLRGRPTRANFRTGHLTICTLVPMRSVPHRVICLLGLSENEFPRKAPRDWDDLALRNPHVGDRDPRTEDRQMLLDALLAASERLIITYSGNDERTNAPRPPAVPVGELLDAVDRTVRARDGKPARERVLIKHPLQPFDERNFEPGALSPEVIWSYDRAALDGAKAMTGPRCDPPVFLSAPLPSVDSDVVELRALIDFLDRPVRAFLRRRLGITIREESEEIDDGLPLDLDGLERWQVAQRLLTARLDGLDWYQCKDVEIARGELPPGRLGGRLVTDIAPHIEALVRETHKLRGDVEPASWEVRVRLEDGRLLTGTVPGVYGTLMQSVSFSRVHPSYRLAAWVRLLALTAVYPDQPWQAATLGRAREAWRGELSLCEIPPIPADPDRRKVALSLLAPLVAIHDRGMREPLPIFRQTTAAYAEAHHAGRDSTEAARKKWESGFNYDGEDSEPEQLRVFGELSFDDLLDERPRSDESGDGWDASEESRFGRYARRMWDGLLAHERARDW